MFGFQSYPEDRFPPEKVTESWWRVWNNMGTCQVLLRKEYVQYLSGHPDNVYLIDFVNGGAARTSPGEQLWAMLADVATKYQVRVFKLTMKGGYVPWTGASGDLQGFDAIEISLKSHKPSKQENEESGADMSVEIAGPTYATIIGGLFPEIMPPQDVVDIQNGATHVPSIVTDARRAGQNVRLIQGGPKTTWYWEFPDGRRVNYE